MGKYRFPKVNHKVNNLIRKMNENIKEDPLWKGRFEVRQVAKKHTRFTDGSGYCFYWLYRIYDKKTGTTALKWFDNYDLLGHTNGWKLWEFVNNFIVEKSGAWLEVPRPSYDSPSFINEPLPEIGEEIWM